MLRRSRVVVVAATASLALAGAARGHVTITPPFVEAGVETQVEFEVPNERRGHSTTSLVVASPPGVAIRTSGLPEEWKSDQQSGTAVRWSGFRITGERSESFPATITAHTAPGRVVLRIVQGYDDGKDVSWQAALTVLPATEAESPPQHLRRALTAGAIGLVVIAASLLALRRVRR